MFLINIKLNKCFTIVVDNGGTLKLLPDIQKKSKIV